MIITTPTDIQRTLFKLYVAWLLCHNNGMDIPLIYEIIGYIASLLIALSLMMSSILKLRVINLVGAIFFTAYGMLISAYPVAAVNFFIILIDLYYLNQIRSAKEFFRLLEVQPDSDYLRYFLQFYARDIQKFLPGFAFMPSGDQLIFFILRNVIPAGLIIGEVQDGDCLYVRLDYAIPGYRDLKTARFVYQDKAQVLHERGIRKVCSTPGTPAHQRYLRRMGFEEGMMREGSPVYCLTLREGR